MQKSAGISKAVKPSALGGVGARGATASGGGAAAPNAIGTKQWSKPDALSRKEVQGGHGSPAAFLITLPKSVADMVKKEGSLNPSKPIGRMFMLPKDSKQELEYVEVDISSGIELLEQHFSKEYLIQSSHPAAPFLLMKEGPDAMRIMARGCGHSFELMQQAHQVFDSTLDERQHETTRTRPMKQSQIKERDHAVKIARGLKGRRTLQSFQIKDLILDKFHRIQPGSGNEFYLERSAIFGCIEFEGRCLRHCPPLPSASNSSFAPSFSGQPEQAIKEEVSKLCNYMSNGDRKGFYELRKVRFFCMIQTFSQPFRMLARPSLLLSAPGIPRAHAKNGDSDNRRGLIVQPILPAQGCAQVELGFQSFYFSLISTSVNSNCKLLLRNDR